MVKRIYVEKKKDFAVRAKELREEILHYLGIENIERVRILIRYDVENISEEIFKRACFMVFSEPPVDQLYEEEFPTEKGEQSFSVEYLPGQFDQRADSAVQCVKFLDEREEPIIRTATTYCLKGNLSREEWEKIKAYCMNPVDSRETGFQKPETLIMDFEEPEDIPLLQDFPSLKEKELLELYSSLELAMTFRDFQEIQHYFQKEEKRFPSITEIRLLDTYWSDHCRHTTFLTQLKEVTIEEGYYKSPIEKTYRNFLKDREEVYKGAKGKYICLMDLALMAMRKLKREGRLKDLEESEEVNACSIIVPASINGKEEEWIVSFKNETHNHPTEIEPFGGAATCLGGAIRDPLSGRTYVYQAMRVTGAADPTGSVQDTRKGKLPQKKIVKEAAAGYSSYGNQIGLATGYVKEIYHPQYMAKRMEIGACIGAAKRTNIVRKEPLPGDVIILLGGRTGRDGCGGATGSSKAHTESSIETCGAQVQKGNAPTERKIQRLFSREEVSTLIKRCNDFGAGGVAVAIGELADGLWIDLDKVPKKYAGLNGTELAISESQERMAVVLDERDKETFLSYALEENLEAVEVAKVTEDRRLIMSWRGKEIVNISRDFLDTNGARQEAEVRIQLPAKEKGYFEELSEKDTEKLSPKEIKEMWLDRLRDLNVCSQKGLVEMFDSSIGSSSVIMPYGGKYQWTESQTMVAKLPVKKGETNTVTIMSYGFDPYLSSWSPYHGAVYAVTESIGKIVAQGGDFKKIRFSFQEYFPRMTKDPKVWGQPVAALLGAYNAQMGFGLAAIGGKDSMSGTFQEMNVPPTFVSFAVDIGRCEDILTPELKRPGNKIVRFQLEKDEYYIPFYDKAKAMYEEITGMIRKGIIVSAYGVDGKGLAPAISKMAFGNGLGVHIEESVLAKELFAPGIGDIVAEISAKRLKEVRVPYNLIGEVIEEGFVYKEMSIGTKEALRAWTETLEKVYPTKAEKGGDVLPSNLYRAEKVYICKNKVPKPTVFIPVFPGTNCEYDSGRAFEKAGATVSIKVFNNLSSKNILESVEEFSKSIQEAQILMLPGGFSAGDEPDGSAKFFATVFQNEKMKEAVHKLLKERDGLALGICNGFQALIKLGLVLEGDIREQKETSPTLTYNTINRHISKMAYLKVVSNKSPWLQEAELGGVYVNPVSHGEGRFVAKKEWLDRLFQRGQVGTQYCDPKGNITMDEEWNVNGSYMAIEGITSPDGRCYGKMSHSERRGPFVAKNIYGEQDLRLFQSGVKYFL